MSSVTISIKHLLAVLKMPGKIGDKIIRMQFILSKLTGNLNFPTPWPANVTSLIQLGIDVTAFINAQTSVKNRVVGAVGTRNMALATVMADLRSILTMVQLKADGNPAAALAVIEGAGYLVRAVGIKQKQLDGAHNTNVSGTVMLTGSLAGHHEWGMSKDMVTITNLPSTSKAHTLVTDLNPGDVWYFRNRKIGTAGKQYNWTGWVRLRVGEGGTSTLHIVISNQ
jgi:hypothetical protein